MIRHQNSYFRFYLIVMMIALMGCTDEIKEPLPLLPLEAQNGEWWVRYDADFGNDSIVEDYYRLGFRKLKIYNTAVPDSVWIEDEGNFWNFKVKVSADMFPLDSIYIDTTVVVTADTLIAMTDTTIVYDTVTNISTMVNSDTVANTAIDPMTDAVYDIDVLINNPDVVEMPDGDSIRFRIGFSNDAPPFFNYIVLGRRVKGFIDGAGQSTYEADYKR